LTAEASSPATGDTGFVTHPAGARRPKTKWGDRVRRRQDILDSARAQIAHGGYLALNMRELASGAGISPGTLYSYFATKEEIYATLYAEAIEAHNSRIAPMCEDAPDMETFLVELARAHLDLYGTYGRHFALWAALKAEAEASDAPLPPELTRALRKATVHQGELVSAALQRLSSSGPIPPADLPAALAFLWSVLNGVGDHLYSERHHLSGVTAAELIHYSARVIAAGLAQSSAN
jgi:AcrR family transcriptional regulator